MIVNLPVLTADRPALVSAHAAADLLATFARAGYVARRLLLLPQSRPEHGKCRCFVSVLRALAFATNAQPCRPVRHHDAAFHLVPVLPAWARTFRGRPFEIGISQHERGIDWLRQHGDRDGGSVNAAFAFGWWDALPAVAARFVSERFASLWAAYLKDDEAGALLDQLKVKAPSVRCAWRTRGAVR